MNLLAVVLSVCALLLSLLVAFGVREQRTLHAALSEEIESRRALETTLVDILDEDQNVRGQLALPGKVLEQTTASELRDAKRELQALVHEAESARLERDRANVESFAVLDSDGVYLTRLRVPGEIRTPDLTPCGELCRYAERASSGAWFCKAARGEAVDDARRRFLNAEDQCEMFTYSSSEHAKEAKLRKLMKDAGW